MLDVKYISKLIVGFFEVFTGTITDGLRDKEWKFADLT